jgi:hypothetical protein
MASSIETTSEIPLIPERPISGYYGPYIVDSPFGPVDVGCGTMGSDGYMRSFSARVVATGDAVFYDRAVGWETELQHKARRVAEDEVKRGRKGWRAANAPTEDDVNDLGEIQTPFGPGVVVTATEDGDTGRYESMAVLLDASELVCWDAREGWVNAAMKKALDAARAKVAAQAKPRRARKAAGPKKAIRIVGTSLISTETI